MQKFDGYDDIKVNEGYEKLKVGGHILQVELKIVQ